MKDESGSMMGGESLPTATEWKAFLEWATDWRERFICQDHITGPITVTTRRDDSGNLICEETTQELLVGKYHEPDSE